MGLFVHSVAAVVLVAIGLFFAVVAGMAQRDDEKKIAAGLFWIALGVSVLALLVEGSA